MIPTPSVDKDSAPGLGDQKRKRIIITALTAFFAIAMLVLISRGGMCERYERKMERQRLMRDYLDSMRMESEKSKARKAPKGAATDTSQGN